MADNGGRLKKVSGYAKRVFFNDNIEYRDFSDNLVGLQLTSDEGASLFTMGNFSVTTNLDPTPSKTFNTGTFSDYLCLDNISGEDTTYLTIDGNLQTQLNIDITNPLHYVWYGNFSEFLRVSLNDISDNWAAAIYVDNKVGSVSGDNITNYSYDPITDTSTFTLLTKYFINPFSIKYTTDSAFVNDSEELNNLRNLTVNYSSYVIEVNGTEHPIKQFTGSTTTTNDVITITVEGEAFSSVTGSTSSQPYFIKPNEQKRENFFSGLDEFQRNLLNRLTSPIYTVDLTFPEQTDEGVIVYTNTKLSFPVLDDGYNLNFFNGLYTTYIDELKEISDGFDDNQTNLMVRKYTAEIINSFDSAPRCDADDLINNGQKATNLLNIYGREYDEIKKYINGIKFAHVVTYDKKDNVPDSLVKDLAWMLGFDKIDFLGDIDLTKNLLPSKGYGAVSGTSRNLTLREIDLELYRRIILNIAWLWKSKGTRKAIEFLFRFIGAPESIVEFDEHVYVADKPLDVEQIKRMLYLYTGDVDISKLPFDEDGYPLPPVDGDLRVVSYVDASGITTTEVQDMYYQKGGGWYRETGGSNAGLDTNVGNNPHVGPYDAGMEYINYFTSDCFIPGYTPTSTVFTAHTRIYENLFVNYNNGFINGTPSTFDLFSSPLTLNNQNLGECINLTATIDTNCPALSGGTGPSNILEELCVNAKIIYDEWVEKIKEEPYLRYSPEWEIIKRNNEISSKNYFSNINAGEVCDENSCIEICVTHVDTVGTNPCDDWLLVSGDTTTPFIYFTDADGNKVLFDDFPVCCVANGGIYKNFTFQDGREACYCATEAPCSGLIPVSTGRNGIVVWEQTDGASNVDAFETSEANTDGSFLVTEVSPECCVWYGYEFTVSTNGSVSCIEKVDIQGDPLISTNTGVILETLGNIRQEWKKSVAKFGSTSLKSTELNTVLNTNQTLYDSYESAITEELDSNRTKRVEEYNPGGNLNIELSIYNTIGTEYNRLNDAVYLKSTTEDIISTDFGTAYSDPSLSDCTVWEPKIDQQTGFVSFQWTDEDGAEILLPESEQLFTQCCKSKGFKQQCYQISGVDGSLILTDCQSPTTDGGVVKIEPTSRFSGGELSSPSLVTELISKCVDPNFIICDDIEDVKLVLATNEWNGFLLPKEIDGECKVEINLDMMIKYDADDLISCATENTCGLHLTQYDNSLYDLNCMNWITFTKYDNVLDDLNNNIQIVDLNQVIDWVSINPDYVDLGDFNSSQYVPYFDDLNISVWQTPGLQSEPDVECCESLGGTIISKERWTPVHQDEVTISKKDYETLISAIREDNVPPEQEELSTLIIELTNLTTQYNDLVGKIDCIEIPSLSGVIVKGFDYTQLITTQNVCHLPAPPECGIYSLTIEEYWSLINQIQLATVAIQDCIDQRETLQQDLSSLIREYVELQTTITAIQTDCDTTISGYTTQLLDCQSITTSINDEISDLETQITDLEAAIVAAEIGPYTSTTETKEEFILKTNIQISLLTAQLNPLYVTLEEQETLCYEISTNITSTQTECDTEISRLTEESLSINEQIVSLEKLIDSLRCCNAELIVSLGELTVNVIANKQQTVELAKECYDEHNIKREENYQAYLSEQVQQVLTYVDDLEICLTLEVDNNLGETVDLNSRYTTLSQYTTPVWSFRPHEDYTGIIINGDSSSVDLVKQSMFVRMRDLYGDSSVTENTFEPNWQHVSLPLSDFDLRQLKTLYPNKPFFIGVEIKGFECGVCVLVDNIQINIETDEIERKFSMESCPSFDLRCVIDDKKSWVFSDGGVTKYIDIPGVSDCNKTALSGNSNTIIQYNNPQERLWLDLEYRYTDYEVNHEHLVLNSKSSTFRIDAAKAIECDVYDFWKNVDCVTSACTGTSSDCLITGYTDKCSCVTYTSGYTGSSSDCITCPDGYVLESDNVTCTKIIEEIVTSSPTVYGVTSGSTSALYGKFGGRFYDNFNSNQLPLVLNTSKFYETSIDIYGNVTNTNEVVSLSTVSNSLWEERLDTIGVWTDEPAVSGDSLPINEWVGFSFCIDANSATTYTIGMAADNRLKLNLNGESYMVMDETSLFNFNYWHVFTINLSTGRNIVEMFGKNTEGLASLGAEIYSTDIPTLTGITTESALSGVTVFTTENFRDSDTAGFDLGETSGFACPSGFALQTCGDVYTCVSITKVDATPPCSALSETFEVCTVEKVYIEVNPLDFLDKNPSEVNVKTEMDKMVLSNLIDVKSRQVLGGYPLLWAYYELYLNADNCGEDLSGHLDYNNLFEFTDLIGDYWLDLLEQVIPSTTIMDGCSNSGKVYRNNIFDQPKHSYKRYALNYFFEDTDGTVNGTSCTLEGMTSESIGEERLCIELSETLIKTSGETLNSADIVIDSYNSDTIFNKVFITQIYDTNEYEGDITVVGDDEWDKNDELLQDCSESPVTSS